MKIRSSITLFTVCAVLTGCNSSKSSSDYEKVLDEKQIHNVLLNAKPPQQFGFNVYQTPAGIAMSGSARLHPRHTAKASFRASEVPVIRVTGSAFRIKMDALLDTASAESWMEFGTAMDFKATFLGLDGRTIPYQGASIIGQAPAFAAVISQMRIDQLFIESIPVYVRMATGSLGPLGRGIQNPKVEGILGYDILRNFEYVQFNLAEESVSFSATIPYTPNESALIGQARIANVPGLGLAVEGAIGGQSTPILLDVAGNYDFARADANIQMTKMVSLGDVVYMNTPTIMATTVDGLPRAGLRMLRKYRITICPRSGVVYFERPAL